MLLNQLVILVRLLDLLSTKPDINAGSYADRDAIARAGA